MTDIPALAARIRGLKGARVIVAVAGPPGAGKSTLAAALVAQLENAVLVPMDGFHLDNGLLDARGLRARKGAPESFDAAGFAALMRRLRTESGVVYPVFDRDRDLSIAGAGAVSPEARHIIVEGNYLLLDVPPWNQLHYDLTVMVSEPIETLTRRLTARWNRLGCDAAETAEHLDNDLANAELVTGHSRKADMVLTSGGQPAPARDRP